MITPAPHFCSIRRLRSIAPGLALVLFVAMPGLSMPPAMHAAPAAPKAAAPADSATVEATDLNTLRAHLNEQITVHGTAIATGVSKSGTVAYLNFGPPHSAMALVFFLKPGSSGKVGSVDDIKPFVGKAVIVTGKLTDFKGDLQIAVETLAEINVAP